MKSCDADDQFSTVGNAKIECYQKLCAKLRMLCYAGGRDPTPKQVQDMLFETEVISHLTYVVRSKPADFTKIRSDVLGRLIVQFCGIATAFARGNHENQLATHTIVPECLILYEATLPSWTSRRSASTPSAGTSLVPPCSSRRSSRATSTSASGSFPS